jgi:primosomal protein N''
MRSDIVEIHAIIRQERPQAIAIWDGTYDESGAEMWVWLPKHLIDFERRAREVTVTMPEWLARDKKLTDDVGALKSEVEMLRGRTARMAARIQKLESRLVDLEDIVESRLGPAGRRH